MQLSKTKADPNYVPDYDINAIASSGAADANKMMEHMNEMSAELNSIFHMPSLDENDIRELMGSKYEDEAEVGEEDPEIDIEDLINSLPEYVSEEQPPRETGVPDADIDELKKRFEALK
jgi:hypothetical protein